MRIAATCWKISRRDGVKLGFTDHVRDLEVGGVTYKAASGYTRTAIPDTADLAGRITFRRRHCRAGSADTEDDMRIGRSDFAWAHVRRQPREPRPEHSQAAGQRGFATSDQVAVLIAGLGVRQIGVPAAACREQVRQLR